MEFQLEKGFEDIWSIGVVVSGKVVSALIAHESVAVILVFGDPCLKCRCKVVEWGVTKENLPYSRRDFVQLRLQGLLYLRSWPHGTMVVNEEIYIYSNQDCSRDKASGPPPYDAGAAYEALPDTIDKAMVFHAVGKSVILEKDHHKGTKTSLLDLAKGKDIW